MNQPFAGKVGRERGESLSLFHEMSMTVRYLPLIIELVKRDLKLKYRRSFLGYLWSLLNPLMMMTVMMIVFSYMFRFNIENYPLYLICGQTIFNFFNEATNKAMFAIIENGTLLKKVYVPKCVFPLSRVLSGFVTMSLSLLAVVIVMLITRVRFHASMLLFFVGTQTVLIIPVHIQMRPGRINVVSIFRVEFPVIVLGTVSTTFSSATVMAGYTLSCHSNFHLLSGLGLLG